MASWLTAALGPADDDPLSRVLAADYVTYLPGDLLPKLDVASMAASLEARSPLLDHCFVELVASLPSSSKVLNGVSKLALRDAFRGIVPDTVLTGPKHGFSIPLDAWFRGPLAAPVTSMLLADDAYVPTVIQRRVLERLMSEHRSGRRNHGERLFALLWLEVWWRMFVNAGPPLTAPDGLSLTDLV